LNLQQRTFAVIENGTWAPKAGDLIREFLDKELKQMTVLNDELTINSHLSADKESELDSMADSIADSVKAEIAAASE
jgi:flavorubredoxin